MAKFDNSKAIAEEKELEAENRMLHRPNNQATGSKVFRALGITEDKYGTQSSDAAQEKEREVFSKARNAGESWRDSYLSGKQAASEVGDEQRREANRGLGRMKKGGKVKVKTSSASKRADGIAQRGKTRGKYL